MLKDEAGSVDPVGVFRSGARGSGNNVFTRGGSFPLCLLEKGDEVANLVDSSLMEKKDRAPAVIASKHRIEPRKRSRCFSVGLPTPQIDRHLVVRKKCFKGRPSHSSNRQPPPAQGEGGMNTYA